MISQIRKIFDYASKYHFLFCRIMIFVLKIANPDICIDLLRPKKSWQGYEFCYISICWILKKFTYAFFIFSVKYFVGMCLSSKMGLYDGARISVFIWFDLNLVSLLKFTYLNSKMNYKVPVSFYSRFFLSHTYILFSQKELFNENIFLNYESVIITVESLCYSFTFISFVLLSFKF